MDANHSYHIHPHSPILFPNPLPQVLTPVKDENLYLHRVTYVNLSVSFEVASIWKQLTDSSIGE
jgi:hypothetical protein